MHKIIVTIGRQFGSGGKIIGERLARKMGVVCYDKELIQLAAQESGICVELFEKADEKGYARPARSFASGLSFLTSCSPNEDILSNESLFKLQSDTIRMLAERESCVLIGRCSDYILRNHPGCISVFVHDDYDKRIERLCELMNISASKAKETMTKIDKSRAAYYNYYTGKNWSAAPSYHFSVNVSSLGMDGTVEALLILVAKKTAFLISD
jgi:cytidylate kinase